MNHLQNKTSENEKKHQEELQSLEIRMKKELSDQKAKAEMDVRRIEGMK